MKGTRTISFPLLITIFILIVIALVVVVLLRYVYHHPECGGTLNPNLRYCNPTTSRVISGRTIPEDTCNPVSNTKKLEMATEFVDYLGHINSTAPKNVAQDLRKAFPQSTVLGGSLFFAIPPLLKLLPSDFGQNEVTPYGIVSFSDVYLKSCITDQREFCTNVAKGNQLVDVLCQQYLIHLSSQDSVQCPFFVSDKNKELYIQDSGFFNLIGALGTFSLTPTQCVVLYYDFPVGKIPLNYWSFNLYLADRLKKDKCAPYRQTYLASLSPPMNCFMTPAIAQKKFNPLTGQGDVVETSHVKFYMVVALDPNLAREVARSLQTQNRPYDFIHIFDIPSGSGSMVLDNEIPNPNGLKASDTFYNYETDRLSLFLRLSPDPNVMDKTTLQQYIYSSDPFQNTCEVCFLDTNRTIPKVFQVIPYQQPQYIETRFNEKTNLQAIHTKLLSSFTGSLRKWNHLLTPLPARSSVFNIFAPLFPSILATNRPYLGGWQALQLAGCAQGDNPDTQYRLSSPVCLSFEDVMISVAVNHAKFGNCLYNNVNVVDINKAFSVASITLNNQMDVDYYIVMVGRDPSLVDKVRTTLKTALVGLKVGYYPVYLETGPTMGNGVPLCHQLLMVERTYINMQYPSITKKGVVYDLEDVFGLTMKEFLQSEEEDRWNSLTEVVAPSVQTLLLPSYYKLRCPSYRQVTMYILVTVLVLCFTVWWVMRMMRRRWKQKGNVRKGTLSRRGL